MFAGIGSSMRGFPRLSPKTLTEKPAGTLNA